MVSKPCQTECEDAQDYVKVQVFVWKSDCPGVPPHQRLLRDLDVWSDLKRSGYDNETECFRLKRFMGYMCRGHPCVEKMQVRASLSEHLQTRLQPIDLSANLPCAICIT